MIDVLEADPQFGLPSARLLQHLLPQGLCVSPMTMVELGAAFAGDLAAQRAFLRDAAINTDDAWTEADTVTAHAGWHRYLQAKRLARVARRPVADLLIGAFAANRRGLVTRNAGDFTSWFPQLKVREP